MNNATIPASNGVSLTTLFLLGILLLALLGIAAAVYLYVQKLKTNHAKVLSEKNKEIKELRLALEKVSKPAVSVLPPLTEAEILSSVESALADGEFRFYLQPEVDQFTNKIIGAEALVRWVRPGKGVYTPGAFLPTLEKHGFVTTLDRYIFQQVCMLQRGRLKKRLPTVPISVNLTRTDLEDENLLAFMKKQLAESHVPASLIPLEIAAHSFTNDIELFYKLVERLREDGFHISIDNLGINKLSLEILKDIPSDILKLDVKTIQASQDDAQTQQLLSSILRMGHMSNKNILVGNIETKEQASHLKYIGFRNAQGFLYHKSMPVHDFEKLLTPPRPQK